MHRSKDNIKVDLTETHFKHGNELFVSIKCGEFLI
jgi:hypothetical protein